MRIKQSDKIYTYRNFLPKMTKKRKILLNVLSSIFLLLIISWGLISFFEPHIKNRIENYLALRIGNFHKIPLKILNAHLMSNPPKLKIDIKHKDFQKIAFQRQQSINNNLLTIGEGGSEDVPATINYANEVYKVSLRLKGTLKDHWENEDMWSLKIKVKGNKTIKGMKEFSIQHPKTRSFAHEWLFQRLAAYLNIIHLRYEFVSVNINGKGDNIYAIEEGFEKRLIERNKRKEGVIVKLNKSFFWFKNATNSKVGLVNHINESTLIESLYGASIEPYKKGKVLTDPTLHAHFLKAKEKLELFRKGKLSTSEVFNTQQLAYLFAIVNLYGPQHATKVHNLRFYFNPITSKLEPIARDQGIVETIETYGILGEEKKINQTSIPSIEFSKIDEIWFNLIFKDKAFFETYLLALEEISKTKFLDKFFETVANDLKGQQAILDRDYPQNSSIRKALLYQNLDFIKASINPENKIHTYLHHINKDDRKIGIEIKNVCTFPIEILSLTIGDSFNVALPNSPFIQASNKFDIGEKILIEFDLPNQYIKNDSILKMLSVNYRFLKNNTIASSPVFQWADKTGEIEISDLANSISNLEKFSFLNIDEINKIIYFKKGKHEIIENLILPKGYKVVAFENTVIDLKKGANILSHSPINFLGQQDSPIIIQSSDSTSQGFVVMNTGRNSLLEYVYFDNLASPNQESWSLSGAITFYYSPVKFNNCRFSNNRSGDDLLNLVHSNFSLENSVFTNTNADALDSDYSNGIIKYCSFKSVGNDAIDISGSELIIEDLVIDQVGDKAISAGENSTIKCKKGMIKNSELALASKDQSTIVAENLIIENCKVAYTLFQKKPEFGPGSITVQNTQLIHTEIPYLLEEGSTLSVNNEIILPNKKNVAELLYGNEFGKSSR